MDEKKTLVRPPFDENGNVVWTDEEKPMKKKALRWWVWLIPVGLICVIGAGVLLYKAAHRKTPQELCRAALRDAWADGLGYREPLMKAMHMQDLAEIFDKAPTDIGISLTLRGTNLTLADLGFGKADETDTTAPQGNSGETTAPQDSKEDTSKPLSDYVGFGFGINIGLDGDNVGMDLRGSISALSLSLLKTYYDGDSVYLTSPKLLKEVLYAKIKEIPGKWESAPLWDMLKPETQESAKGAAESGIALLKKGALMFKNAKKALAATYPAEESLMDHLLGAIEYEQCKDAKGKVLTEMVVIGSEKVPCYVFRIQVNEDEFYEMASAVAGAVGGESAVAEVHKAWKLAPDASDPDDNGVRVFAYVTKAGELAKLTAEVSGLVYGKPAKVNAELLCVGEEDPQDKMYLTVKADIDGKSYGLDAKKTVNATRARVSSRIEVSLQLPDMPQYGFNAAINYNIAGALLDLEANTVYKGDTVGTLKLTGECNYKTGWEINVNEVAFADRYTGKNASFSGRLVFAPTQYAPEKPEGQLVDLLTLTPEEAQELIKEGKEQLEWYYNKFIR